MNAFRPASFPLRRQRLPKFTLPLPTRAFIHMHLWDHLRLSFTRSPQHRKVLFPDVNLQRIWLPEDWGTFGLTPLSTVMEKHLGPGKALSRLLKRPPPGEEGAKGSAGEDGLVTAREGPKRPFTYDLLALNTFRRIPKNRGASNNQQSSLPKDVIGCRADEVHLRIDITPKYLQIELTRAYRFLAAGRLLAVHLHRPMGKSYPETIPWAMQNRMDLHPEVILRAMPEGTLCVVQPRIDEAETDLVWMYASREFSFMGRQGEELARMLEKQMDRLSGDHLL